MKVLVLGAGVVGTAAAYYLARDGHDVTVVDRNAGPAMGTSQSNAGLVSPGDATAWASPAALVTFFKSLYKPDMGIKVNFTLDPQFLIWGLRFMRQCTAAKAQANTQKKLRLALYSRDCINELSGATGVTYDDVRKGIVYFYRSQASLDAGARHMQFLADHGLKLEIVNHQMLIEIEPGLRAMNGELAGGVYSPMDQTGDSRLFVERLAAWSAQHLGVKGHYGANVEGLEIAGNRITAVKTSKGTLSCDAVVFSLGPESGAMGRKFGLDVPVYPVKGYTATLPIAEGSGPTMGGVDEDKLIAYSRLGDRLRLACTAEFAGFDRSHKPVNFARLFAVARELFPGCIDESRAVLWAGLRPMMPGSVPVHGRARYDNLWLNTGHGHVGWTMACGSGKFVSDLIAGRKPEIDPSGLLYKN